ncbi:hypothetical protein DXG01_000315 [Tephrocybe rancida]|nr:hypothetical protein DXG01_000315 [Tephrocybe rancida]
MSLSSSPTVPDAKANSDHASSIASSSPPNIISPPSTKQKPKTPILPPTSTTQARPLADIIGETFPPFDHHANIVSPFNNELSRDSAFEKELSSMLLDAILEMHAWASARPKHESSVAAQNIEKKIVSVMETEKEQGMYLSRPRLSSSLYTGIVGRQHSLRNVFTSLLASASVQTHIRYDSDGTLITQRLHFAPAPHPYRHVLGWYRLARELQEAGVDAVCVFDGKERNMAKAREAERRREVQRKVQARGALEIDRSQRLRQLSDVLPKFWDLDDTARQRAAGLLRQLAPDATAETRTPPERPEDIPQKPPPEPSPETPLAAEPTPPRLSVDVEVVVPEYVADETLGTDGQLIADYAEALLLEGDPEHIERLIPHNHPWFQDSQPAASFETLEYLPHQSEDMYTPVALHHEDIQEDITTQEAEVESAEVTLPPDIEGQLPTPPVSSDDPTLLPSVEEPPTSTFAIEDMAPPVEETPIPSSSQGVSPLPELTPLEDIPNQLTDLYLSYKQSVSRLATLSDPLPSPLPVIPSVGDADTQAEIVMTKAQYQLTLEEGRFWDSFASQSQSWGQGQAQWKSQEQERATRLPDTLEKLSKTSDMMSASFERRMNPPTSSTYYESKEILRAMGVPCLETSGAFEAEALASAMVLNGLADYVVSEDTDVLVYEAPLVRNLTSKNMPLTVVSGAEIRTVLQLDRASFIDFALLLGTDFSQRIKNVGPARALKFIREHKSIERVIELETKYALPLSQQAYLDQVQIARVVFETLPPLPEIKLLEQKEPDEEAVLELLQRYGLGKEVMGTSDWDQASGVALEGNYFQDNPSAF